MRPFQILIFIFSVFMLLFLVAWIFPENGIQIGKNVHLKFASLSDYLEQDTIQYADISKILEKVDLSSLEEDLEYIAQVFPDSVVPEPFFGFPDTIIANADSLRQLTYSLQYQGDEPVVLYPFFRKLSSLRSQKKLLRILHYGDSQIEADRMSSFIRHRMQVNFGGSGCGTVPAVPLYNGQLSIKQEYSENWNRFTGFGPEDPELGHERYGALMSFVRQNYADTSRGNNSKTWLSFRTSPLSYSSSRVYSDVSLFIQADMEPVTIHVSRNDSIFDSVALNPSNDLKKYKWHFTETPEDLKFTFAGKGFTNIYGISLDNSWGIALDNIPLRGSSGLVFSKTDTAFLKQMYKMMDVGLVILQFGGNVVPYMKDNFTAYKRYFKRELSVIKKLLPGIPVVVIGPSDMSVKEKDKFITYSNLEDIRDAIKFATLESGFVFWDMYEAMGGKNSMPSWVSAQPPLAVADYVHFNARGAKVIAEMFSNALLYEYNYWQLKSRQAK